jgi:SPP1 family predicted phage head-tail adaptor
MPLSAGDLTARIALERDEITLVSGREVRAPYSYCRPWAKPEALSGREAWKAQQVDSSVNWRFVIRYRTDVKPSDRVVYRGKTMEIRAVLPDEERRDAVVLLCEVNG